MTLAHPAAILPLRRLGLPMTALAAGSMVPDIPLFLGWVRGYEVTHSVVGVLVVDVVLATGVVLLWFHLVRDALVDLAPEQVRSRLPATIRPTRRERLLVPVAGSVGAATHLLWDSFTHPGRWGPRHIEWLRTEHEGLLGLKWIQYSSGVIGLVIVGWAVVTYLRSRDPIPDDRGPSVLPAVVLPAVVTVAGLVGAITAAIKAPSGFHAMAFHGVINSLITVTMTGGVACLAWQVARHRRAATRP
ncbi:DUF4184 family protein [Nocardioides pelophilus]|uniref:DUF4184 family protein n=1 Tax=Nocardioides pelophilus TaxID=2172019 RepID=UPI001FE876B3|nr:DUF4184 family protein [Nocardioides pelophilus]